jgi:16S rRNA (guanine966-N2)-methyltransferase
LFFVYRIIYKVYISVVNNQSSIRVIAGTWRGRRINFPTIHGVRPTQDRIRETLFNWLQLDISGALCLDLFAGSGALGIEALSRGAEHVTFVDSSSEVVASINSNLEMLGSDAASVICSRVPDGKLLVSSRPFDIIFLDPPFSEGLLLPTISWLRESQLISDDTILYFEVESSNTDLNSILDINIYKEKKTSNILYGLFTLTPVAHNS